MYKQEVEGRNTSGREFDDITPPHLSERRDGGQTLEERLDYLDLQIELLDQGVPQVIDMRLALKQISQSEKENDRQACAQYRKLTDRAYTSTEAPNPLLEDKLMLQMAIHTLRSDVAEEISVGLKHDFVKINNREHLFFIEHLIDGAMLQCMERRQSEPPFPMQWLQKRPVAENAQKQAFEGASLYTDCAYMATFVAPVCAYINSLETSASHEDRD